jgi:subtilisin family serine protease
MSRLNSAFVATMSATLVLTALAGCGRTAFTTPSAQMLPTGVEASKAVLAKRLVVGFASMPSASTLSGLEKAHGIKVVKQFAPLGLAVVETKEPIATRKALLAVNGVQFVEGELLPELEMPRVTQVRELPRQGRGTEDPMYKDQWHFPNMGAPKVWAALPNLKTVTVAVVDTGCDLEHPDLKGNLVPGWNAAAPGTPPSDQAGHGTMTAGCVGAIANNGIGVRGMAPNAKLMPVKVGNSASSVVEAMIWAADHADMITMSLSFKPNMTEYPVAVESTKRAANYVMSKKVPMVCSMGNTGSSSKNVPSYFAGNEVPGLIAVGATDAKDKVTSFSTYGNWTSVSAPGSKILTTAMGGKYGAVDGTSFSTPLTAGVVAMMLGNGHAKDPAAVKATLQKTALDIETPGYDDKSGAGRVDAAKAVMGNTPAPAPTSHP